MATEKIGIYRRWLESAPAINGVPVPKEQWPTKRRHCWEVRWFGTTGKRYSKNFKIKRLAEQFARKLQEDVNSGRQNMPTKMKLHDFIKEHEKLMPGQVAHATLVEQMHELKLFEKFIGRSIQLAKITPRHAEGFIADRLSSELSVATVNKGIRTLRGIFNIAIEPRGYVKEGQNPFAKIRQRKKSAKPVRDVSIDEYHSLIESIEELWWRAFISVAYCSGLRREEILNLTWNDVDFENQYIHVTPKENSKYTIEWEPKDHECRVVPMPEETTQLLVDIQSESPEGFPYVFMSPDRFEHIKKRIQQGDWNSKCETVNNIVKNFTKLRKKAGIDKCTIHDMRRSAITNWAQHLPIQVVQQFAGHSSITTTRKYYLTVRSENIASASKIINEMLKGAKLGLTQK